MNIAIIDDFVILDKIKKACEEFSQATFLDSKDDVG